MEAQKYLTKHKLDKTHWGKRIIQAENEGEFTGDDIEDSESWMSCACGKLDKRIPREEGDGSPPKDDKLSRLGYSFYELVEGNDFLEAARTLKAIEDRGNKLLL